MPVRTGAFETVIRFVPIEQTGLQIERQDIVLHDPAPVVAAGRAP
jgi:hypothetical protein